MDTPESVYPLFFTVAVVVFQITPVKICDFDLASGLDGLSAAVTTPELQTPVIISFVEIKAWFQSINMVLTILFSL